MRDLSRGQVSTISLRSSDMTDLVDDFWYGTELYKAQSLIIESCIKLNLCEYYNRISVEWSNHLKTTIGNARTKRDTDGMYRGRICLSIALWPRAPESQRRETVIHEAAHVLAFIVFNERCGHGPKWKWVMKQLGYPNADRCHTVDTKGLRRPLKRYLVPCDACQTQCSFTIEERNKVLLGDVILKCGRCRTRYSTDVIRNAKLTEIQR